VTSTMIIHTYSGDATSEFVSMVATGGASSEPHPRRCRRLADRHLARELTQARAARIPLIGIGIRTAPADRVLQNQTWTDIALRLARHRGLFDDRPWVAIRTGEQSVELVAQTDRRTPLAVLVELRDQVQRVYALTPTAQSARAFPPTHPSLSRPTGHQPGRTAPLARYGRRSRVAVAVASDGSDSKGHLISGTRCCPDKPISRRRGSSRSPHGPEGPDPDHFERLEACLQCCSA
jgi:hypothetical protein